MTVYHNWWKILGVVFIIYVLVRGILTPLKPGIFEISPSRFESGNEINIHVEGYNTFYTKGNLLAYIKHSDQFLIPSSKINVTSDNSLNVIFNIPKYFPDSNKLAQFTFILTSDHDGTTVLPSRIIIHQDSIDYQAGVLSWTLAQKPVFSNLHKYWFPYRNILHETIRNTFFHVSLWFTMFWLLFMSVYFTFKYLKTNVKDYDLKAFALVRTAIFFGVLGCLTGALWARYTWGTWWTKDIKLNMAAISLLIYFAYLILRASIDDEDRKARISGAYNIFALVAVVPLIFVLPRLTDSLHPGNGGNPAFGAEDMDNALRLVFYPSVIGFICLGCWMASLLYRLDRIQLKFDEKDNNS